MNNISIFNEIKRRLYKLLSGQVKPYSSWKYNQTNEFQEPNKCVGKEI